MQKKRFPRHVAIIMDGNGRWAKSKGFPRFQGHREGVDRVEEVSEAANQMGIEVLTFFTFSTENWKRPKAEVSMLMKTVGSVLNKRAKKLGKSNIRIASIGRRDGLPKAVLESLEKAIELTKNNTGLIVNMAFNYGSRVEILDAVKSIATRVKNNELRVDQIDEELFSRFLYTKDFPDPDLLIRTSGEQRISNFLLWQLSYAEFYFTEKYWPEFTPEEFNKAIFEYQRRDRRYGQVKTPK
ncbi:MAG: isoprenyl transferase [Candidatus Omnitrophica bacterium]|nr:isoprenyl transferase [Candidatus Omnitrophota bacterium]